MTSVKQALVAVQSKPRADGEVKHTLKPDTQAAQTAAVEFFSKFSRRVGQILPRSLTMCAIKHSGSQANSMANSLKDIETLKYFREVVSCLLQIQLTVSCSLVA